MCILWLIHPSILCLDSNHSHKSQTRGLTNKWFDQAKRWSSEWLHSHFEQKISCRCRSREVVQKLLQTARSVTKFCESLPQPLFLSAIRTIFLSLSLSWIPRMGNHKRMHYKDHYLETKCVDEKWEREKVSKWSPPHFSGPISVLQQQLSLCPSVPLFLRSSLHSNVYLLVPLSFFASFILPFKGLLTFVNSNNNL